jgi:hypothetical protein
LGANSEVKATARGGPVVDSPALRRNVTRITARHLQQRYVVSPMQLRGAK